MQNPLVSQESESMINGRTYISVFVNSFAAQQTKASLSF